MPKSSDSSSSSPPLSPHVLSISNFGFTQAFLVDMWKQRKQVDDLQLQNRARETAFNKITLLANPKANLVHITSLPLSILLCFNAVPTSTSIKTHNDNQQPLLQECVEDISTHSGDAFSNAGIWSHVTFRWLNPLFKKGRTQKLELPDIPSIPQSKTAAKAFSLLEESLVKQKTSASSLPNALFTKLWREASNNSKLTFQVGGRFGQRVGKRICRSVRFCHCNEQYQISTALIRAKCVSRTAKIWHGKKPCQISVLVSEKWCSEG
ncbi:hypothetical protein LguiB_026206 [Lonicera macranthoides]